MNKIKLMADYQCFPLWNITSIVAENVDPQCLPISDELRDALIRWGNEYDSTLNLDDPSVSGFINPEEERAFKERGSLLFEWLKKELGSGFTVSYQT